MQKDYFMLSRVDLHNNSTWQQWQSNTADSSEMILGLYKTLASAYENLQQSIKDDDTRGYIINSYCSCCGKYATTGAVWFDPEQKQLYGG